MRCDVRFCSGIDKIFYLSVHALAGRNGGMIDSFGSLVLILGSMSWFRILKISQPLNQGQYLLLTLDKYSFEFKNCGNARKWDIFLQNFLLSLPFKGPLIKG